MCGEKTLNWDAYIHFCESGWDTAWEQLDAQSPYNLHNLHVTRAHSRAQIYSSMRRFIQEYSAMSHIHLLLTCLGLESTDPRDKIFGLYGLGKEEDRAVLAPDYSKSVVETYTDAAKLLILSTKTINILCINTCSKESRHSPIFPSWVPDWCLCESRTARLWNPAMYDASKDRRSVLHPCLTRRLKVEGIVLD